MTPVTTDLLRENGVREAVLLAFAAAFPDGLTPSPDATERAEQAARLAVIGVDIEWAAESMLSDHGLAEYGQAADDAESEYDRARALAFLTALAADMDHE